MAIAKKFLPALAGPVMALFVAAPASAAIFFTPSGVFEQIGSEVVGHGSIGLDSGNYNIKWSTEVPITDGAFNFEYAIHEQEFINGILVSDTFFNSDGGFFGLAVGATHGFFQYHVPSGFTVGGPDHYLVDTFHASGSFLVSGGPNDVGKGWTLSVAQVPEPTVWSTMILGFALAGAALRRRRPVVVAA